MESRQVEVKLYDHKFIVTDGKSSKAFCLYKDKENYAWQSFDCALKTSKKGQQSYTLKDSTKKNLVTRNFETLMQKDCDSLTQSFRNSIRSSFLSDEQIAQMIISDEVVSLLNEKILKTASTPTSTSIVTTALIQQTPEFKQATDSKKEQPAEEKQEAELELQQEEQIAKEKQEAELKRQQEELLAKEKQEAELKRQQEEQLAKEKQEAELKRQQEEQLAKEKQEAELKRQQEELLAKEKQEAELKRQQEELLAKIPQEAEQKPSQEEPQAKKAGQPRQQKELPVKTEAQQIVDWFKLMALSIQFDHISRHSKTNWLRNIVKKPNPRSIELQVFVDIFNESKASSDPELQIEQAVDSLVRRFEGFLATNSKIAKKLQPMSLNDSRPPGESKGPATIPFEAGHLSARMAGTVLKKISKSCNDPTSFIYQYRSLINIKIAPIKYNLEVADLDQIGDKVDLKVNLSSLCPNFAENLKISPEDNAKVTAAIMTVQNKIEALRTPSPKKQPQQLPAEVESVRKRSNSY